MKTLGTTPAPISRVPLDAVKEMLSAIETIAESARKAEKVASRAQEEANQLEIEIDTVNGRLLELARVPRFEKDVLPKQFINGDGFREGWRDWWWESSNRLKALETLEKKWQQWTRDDERDDFLLSIREHLRAQALAIKQHLQSIDAVQQLKVHQPPLTVETQQQYVALLVENLSLRDQAKKDVARMETLLSDVQQRNVNAVALYAESQKYLEGFIQNTERRIKQEEAQVVELDRWRDSEVRRIHGLGQPSSVVIDALQREVASLRKMLQEKEEHLQREIDVWNQQQLVAMQQTITHQMQQLETEYNAQLVKSKSILHLLTAELAKADAEASRRAALEEERKGELVQLTSQLVDRHDVLKTTFQMYSDLAVTTELIQKSWEDLHSSISQFLDGHLVEHQPQVLDLWLQGMECGGKLSMLLEKVDKNLKDRIKAADTTVKHLNALLEFNVDTYDPNAHRWTSILQGILHMRSRLQESLVDNACVYAWLRDEMLPLERTISLEPGLQAPMRRLQREYSVLFDTVLADRVGTAGNEADVAPPRSQYVSPKRKDSPWRAESLSSAALPLSPTHASDSPSSPLPWVQARRWMMPDPDLSFSQHGVADGAAMSWPGSPTLTNSLFDVSVRSMPTTRFDHRQFRLSKSLK
eukprot:GGOE01053166.1.p1 GENE.GGOE01053166.1~~GGOE01053166.1.p1  ORF type:complete len:746 (-),score=188.56 GGOE01053166.1:505-2433(-)